ncbi:hypothetical protein OL548_14735 [Lysinibacillus sp. MHQ-1]|nr:hypothetical protein OL548_14735 [Lysinibacillus sp. MHQ-1]
MKKGKLTDIQIEVNAPLINEPELIGLLQLISTNLNRILIDYIPITVRIIDQQQDVGIVLWDPLEKTNFCKAYLTFSTS